MKERRYINTKSQYEFYENFIPLTKDCSESVPILLSDDRVYLSNFLAKKQFKYLTSVGYFSSNLSTVLIPDEAGNLQLILIKPSKEKRFLIGERISQLPPGKYEIQSELSENLAFEVTLGFCLSLYKFDHFKENKNNLDIMLCLPKNLDEAKFKAFVRAEFFVRNLVNSPASYLGPKNFEDVIKAFAKKRGALFKTIIGDDLLNQNFPMIHTVGRAGAQAPRFVELTWGNINDLKVTLVGKGVCFDSGGLNVKSSSGMNLMKKDMGGAASVLGLAECIISLNLKVFLKVLIPIVENAISSSSFRPGDVLHSRKGLTVEVNNTDAEGRLILADALSYADEGEPDLLVCMATLTGAARVALGPDIAPFYCNDEEFAKTLLDCSQLICDPVWRMPFYMEYESMIQPLIADLDNAPKSGMAGSITAALFLKRFVEKASVFVHFDIFCWSMNKQPGRPVGGLMQGVRSVLEVLETKLQKC